MGCYHAFDYSLILPDKTENWLSHIPGFWILPNLHVCTNLSPKQYLPIILILDLVLEVLAYAVGSCYPACCNAVLAQNRV
jgi:hypothetical protein